MMEIKTFWDFASCLWGNRSQREAITSQKNWIFSNAALRTLNIADTAVDVTVNPTNSWPNIWAAKDLYWTHVMSQYILVYPRVRTSSPGKSSARTSIAHWKQ